jgi:hypothetical protein
MWTPKFFVMMVVVLMGAIPIGAAENSMATAPIASSVMKIAERKTGDILSTSLGDLQITLRSPVVEGGTKCCGIRRWLGYRLLNKNRIVEVREEVSVVAIDPSLARPKDFTRIIHPQSSREFSDELYFGDSTPLPQGVWMEVEQRLFLNGEDKPSFVNRIVYTVDTMVVYPSIAEAGKNTKTQIVAGNR